MRLEVQSRKHQSADLLVDGQRTKARRDTRGGEKMMNGKAEGKKTRRPYRKPRVEQVELRPEEAVLGECKNTESAGPFNPCFAEEQCELWGS